MPYTPTAEDFEESASITSEERYQPTAMDVEEEKPKPRQGVKGMARDTLESIIGLPKAFENMLRKTIPQQTTGLATQLVMDPDAAIKRAPLTAAAGVLETGKGLINAPGYLAEKLGERGFKSAEAIGKALKPYKIGDTGTEKLFLGEEKPGDELIKTIAPLMLMGGRGGGLRGLGRRGLAGGAYGVAHEGDILQNAVLSILPDMIMKTAHKAGSTVGAVKNRGALREKVAGAEEEFAASEQQLKQLQDSLKERFSESSPEALRRSVSNLREEAGELQPQADIPFEETEGLLPGAAGLELIPEAQRKVDSTHKEISAYLGKGKTHDVEAAGRILDTIKARKKEIGRSYESLRKDLADTKVSVPKGSDIKDIDARLKAIYDKSEWDSPEFEEIKAQQIARIESNNKLESIPAEDFLQQYRETKAASHEAQLRGFKEGADPKEQKFWKGEWEKLNKLTEEQYSLMEKSIPAKYLNKLKAANKRWATEVAPLYKISIYQQIKHDGRINSENIIKELRGPHKGREIIRDIIKDNPTIGRHVVGQRYADSPHKLEDIGEEELQYVDELPRLQELRNKLSGANRELKFAQTKKGMLDEEGERIKSGFKETVEKQRQRKVAEAQLSKIHKQIKAKEDAANRWSKEANKKGASEEKRDEAREEQKKANETIDKLNKRRKSILKLLGTAAGTATGVEILKRMLR
jgi:hypothetical protein